MRQGGTPTKGQVRKEERHDGGGETFQDLDRITGIAFQAPRPNYRVEVTGPTTEEDQGPKSGPTQKSSRRRQALWRHKLS